MAHHVLLIQANATDAAIVQRALRERADESLTVEWVRRCSDGLDRLAGDRTTETARADCISAILVDLALPDVAGLDALDRIIAAAPQVPVLVLCAARDEKNAQGAVSRGAQDYLLNARVDSYSLPHALHAMIDRAAVAKDLAHKLERAQLTLNSIGDAVVSTDVSCRVTYLNAVAERLTGWSCEEAAGRPLEHVFRIVDELTRELVNNPMARAVLENRTVGLPPNCVLISRSGVESAIEDSASPILDGQGAVRGAVMVFRDVSEARAESRQTTYLTQHDSLTNLSNRLFMHDRLGQAVALARRTGRPMAVLFVDVDRFKSINDSFGHEIGDRLLQSVAKRLLQCVRSSDTVGRVGGDEFVVLLPEVDRAQDAAVTAETILRALNAPHPIDLHDLHVSLSIGIATYPHDGSDAATLLRSADVAMYRAKECGRNSYKFFEAEMDIFGTQWGPRAVGAPDAIEPHAYVPRYQLTVGPAARAADGHRSAGRLAQLSAHAGAAKERDPVGHDIGRHGPGRAVGPVRNPPPAPGQQEQLPAPDAHGRERLSRGAA